MTFEQNSLLGGAPVPMTTPLPKKDLHEVAVNIEASLVRSHQLANALPHNRDRSMLLTRLEEAGHWARSIREKLT